MYPAVSSLVHEQSQIGEARRNAISIATALGFSEAKCGSLAIVVTELASNLVKHGKRGELFLRPIDEGNVLAVEIITVDSGHGMTSVVQCMRDGYSTAGTPGNGLGAIVRLSDSFDVYSLPEQGTVVVSVVSSVNASTPTLQRISDFSVLSRPKPGQDVCGDSWSVVHLGDRSLYFLADGLGHGPDAALASLEAVRAFRRHADLRPQHLLEAVHGAIHGTRGVAAAVAEIHFQKREVTFCGIGNVVGVITAPNHSQNMISHNGILGHQARKFQDFSYAIPENALLVIHSDGLSQHWDLERIAGAYSRPAGLVAGLLYRDFQRLNDDATVMVSRLSPIA